MNPESNHNQPKKRKHDNDNVKQQQQQQQQQPSRASSYMMNGGVVGSCLECQCKCHEAKKVATVEANLVAKSERTDGDYLDSLPIGYRFEPSDEELLKHYLLKKIKNEFIPKTKISEAYVYEVHPKKLVVRYPQATEDGWYFFTARNKKYPNGDRPDRHAGSGYWKATGGDKVINDENGNKIGGRKSLVYYEGHSPDWTKTKWMMHEYVVDGYAKNGVHPKDKKFNDYVLAKIYINPRMKEDNREVENAQISVPDQPAHSLSNQDINNNVVTVQHDPDQNPNPTPTTLHTDFNNLSIVPNPNQRLNATLTEVRNDVMALDQQTHVVPNYQDVTNKQVMIQVNNNLLVQNYQKMMSPCYSRFPISTIPPVGRNSSPTGLINYEYSPQQYNQALIPCNEQVLPVNWVSGNSTGLTSNPPLTHDQVVPVQEGGNGNQFTQNIEHMINLDGYDTIFDDDFQLGFDASGDIEIKEAGIFDDDFQLGFDASGDIEIKEGYMWCNDSNI